MLQVVDCEKAPRAIGPYSQAIVANGLVFVSGQLPLDPRTMQILDGSVADQTRLILTNIDAILRSAHSDLSKVVKTTIYLKDLAHFDEVNSTYGEFFPEEKPARVTVQVAKLPKDASMEIDAIAVV